MSNTEKIKKAIEIFAGRKITFIHDESKGYAFKTTKEKEWNIIPFWFINKCSGLGLTNRCLLDSDITEN